MKKILFFCLVSVAALPALANNLFTDLTLEHTLVSEESVMPQDLGIGFDFLYREKCEALRGERFDINELINIGQQIWQIVKDGEPTLDFTTKSASAIPAGAVCPFNMAGWSMPLSKTYKLAYKNGFGMEVITFHYKVIFSYGGNFDGRGAYLANVSIHPSNIAVMWGFSFDATVNINNVLNTGTMEDPVAGMEVVLEWNVKNVVNKFKSRKIYYVDGRGNATEL